MSRKVYTIQTSAYVTAFAEDTYIIEAPDLETAKAKALEYFRQAIDEHYSPWQEIEGLRVDYTEVAEYER